MMSCPTIPAMEITGNEDIEDEQCKLLGIVQQFFASTFQTLHSREQCHVWEVEGKESVSRREEYDFLLETANEHADSSSVECSPFKTDVDMSLGVDGSEDYTVSCSSKVGNNGTNTRQIPRLRSALSMSDLQAALRPKAKGKRRARFSSTVHVCLVPTRQELHNIVDDLYFRSDDFTTFKREAVLELREILTRLGITSKQAIQYLYQPQQEDEIGIYGIGVSVHEPPDEYDHGPSMSDDEADETETSPSPRAERSESIESPSPRAERSTSVDCGHIAIEVEGPSMSDDEEETQAYDSKVDDNLRAASFITGAKTDVELNANAQGPSKLKFSSSTGSSVRVLPSVTPSGATSESHATWQVQWKGPKPGTMPAREAIKRSIKAPIETYYN